MEFSQDLMLNSVSEWNEHYLRYCKLEAMIDSIRKGKNKCNQENTPLLYSNEQDCDIFFQVLLDQLLDIIQFYTEKECEVNVELDHLLTTLYSPSQPIVVVETEELLSVPQSSFTSINMFDDRSSSTSITMIAPLVTKNEKQKPVDDVTKQRLIDLYIYSSKLKFFVTLNLQAFTKILNKFDELMNSSQGQTVLFQKIQTAYPFRSGTRNHLDNLISQVEQLYTIMNEDNHLPDLNSFLCKTLGSDRKRFEEDTEVTHEKFEIPKRMYNFFKALTSLAIFAILLSYPLFENVEQQRCFALLVFSSVLWATELMPLFVTALLIPFLIVILRVMRSEEEDIDGRVTYHRLSAMDASKAVFASMLSPVIMLLLGGFSIAEALNKYGIAKSLATFILSKAGTRPSNVLFVNMLVASLASMWISNVAAPVLCFSLIRPILQSLPNESAFGPCLIMGIALASNLGGIASPIASPQNVIAIQNMSPPPSWGDWFCVSIPICLLGNLIVWLWLLKSYRITNNTRISSSTMINMQSPDSPITSTQIFVIGVTVFTIVLWCIVRSYKEILGDMGIIAIIQLVAFFGSGVLTKDDFNNFLWSVIVLAMGGIALGKAVESSGLLYTIASHISERVIGLSSFQVLFIFSTAVLLIATFISHTVAALIIIPIVAKVGTHLLDPNPRLLVMGTTFVCSVAMGLPVSGFPNMTAISQENGLGLPYLKTKDFVKNGVPCSILIMLCVVTVGYVLMELTGI